MSMTTEQRTQLHNNVTMQTYQTMEQCYDNQSAGAMAMFESSKHVMVFDPRVQGGLLKILSKVESFFLKFIQFFGFNREVSFDTLEVAKKASSIRALNPLLSDQHDVIRESLGLPPEEHV